MEITHITSLLGGIALFLYGMSIMGAGLEKVAGGKMQGILQKLTSSTIKGCLLYTSQWPDQQLCHQRPAGTGQRQ